MTIRLLIADDHAMVREGLSAFLGTQPDIALIGQAATGSDAVALARAHQPDVALIDLLLPDIDGVMVCGQIRRACPNTRVLILTSSEEFHSVARALAAGALSYLSKALNAEALLEAIRKAAIGEAVLHPVALDALNAARAPGALDQRLSPRENDVLLLIGRGLSNADIARELKIGETTVKTHVSNLLAKLCLNDRTQAAVFVWRSGLLR
jgi:two-component system, NarL family, response regulator LiaR